MLVIDTRKSIPLDTSLLDWSEKNIRWLDKNTFSIPLHDPALDEIAQYFAYEVAALQPWLFPDTDTITVELTIDFWHSFFRYSLRIGTKPNEHFYDDDNAEYAEFNARRKQAVEANAGKAAYDSFPVLLTKDEEDKMRRALYELGVY